MSDTKIKIKKVETEKLPKSQVKLTVTLAWEDIKGELAAAKKKVLAEAEIKGFRKGAVPEDLFIKQFTDFPFYQEMAYAAVDKTFAEVLIEEKVPVISRPNISIKEFGESKDVVYEILGDVLPEVTLPEYKTLHSKYKEEVVGEVTDQEVEDAIGDIKAWRKQKPNMTEEEKKEAEEAVLSEEDLKAMGVESGKLEDLKTKIRSNLEEEKSLRSQDTRRNKILEDLVNGTSGEMPEAMIENELLKIKDRIIGDLGQMGVSFADYLKHLNKTEEEWKLSEKLQAEKNAKLQMALAQIAKVEKIGPSEVAIEKEVQHLKLHYPEIDEQRLREYSAERMMNTFVLEYVVSGKLPNEEELFKVDHEHNH
jgi:FKBP-type peptidyl-prolyl cis-trans isomerase (trigger factor)